jgi:maltooligosyltrehalose trehalohydrolase
MSDRKRPTDNLPVLGARAGLDETAFGLFASADSCCAVRLFDGDGVAGSTHPMAPVPGPSSAGYFHATLAGVGSGTLYKFVIDGNELPDPYARYLPRGVHGAAEVVRPAHVWRHQGIARPLAEHVIYELHVGTFTDEGTYAAAGQRLAHLAELGVTAVELMPVAAFAGSRGWGYDGVAPYAPFAGYGTPDDLRAFVDKAHGFGLAVFLDVVYNHFGPSGNYLRAYHPAYFTHEIRNAWGDALNYAHPVMRRLVVENALYWLDEFRFDGIRLDATHAIVDPSPRHILRDLADAVAALSPRRLLIAEDDRNDPACVTGLGLDGVWADDFHHSVRVTLTGERDGYYAAYRPGADGIASTVNGGWLYTGQTYPVSGKGRGKPAAGLDAASFVYCIQNHDQVGNRALGDRLNSIVSPDQYRAVSTLLLFLPMTPLLFMGQEWAATSPFLFFTDHEEELGRAISTGRREEFKHFKAFVDPATRASIPDPQAPATFERSRLRWQERDSGEHGRTLALYRSLLKLRREDAVLRHGSRDGLVARAIGDVLVVTRTLGASARTLLLNFGDKPFRHRDVIPRAGMHPAAPLLFRSDADARVDAAGVGDATCAQIPAHTAVIFGDDR